MTETKLISYIITDFISKSEMRVAEISWQEIINKYSEKFKKAGALRQTISRIWDKDNVYRLGHHWEYKDDSAFNECQKIFKLAEKEFKKETGIVWKISSNRGILTSETKF